MATVFEKNRVEVVETRFFEVLECGATQCGDDGGDGVGVGDDQSGVGVFECFDGGRESDCVECGVDG